MKTRANNNIHLIAAKKGGKKMKVINLCRDGGCCPVVKIAEEYIEIGEQDNVCVLTNAEWETLKQKILDKEI